MGEETWITRGHRVIELLNNEETTDSLMDEC